jgi:hypothetical protein
VLATSGHSDATGVLVLARAAAAMLGAELLPVAPDAVERPGDTGGHAAQRLGAGWRQQVRRGVCLATEGSKKVVLLLGGECLPFDGAAGAAGARELLAGLDSLAAWGEVPPQLMAASEVALVHEALRPGLKAAGLADGPAQVADYFQQALMANLHVAVACSGQAAAELLAACPALGGAARVVRVSAWPLQEAALQGPELELLGADSGAELPQALGQGAHGASSGPQGHVEAAAGGAGQGPANVAGLAAAAAGGRLEQACEQPPPQQQQQRQQQQQQQQQLLEEQQRQAQERLDDQRQQEEAQEQVPQGSGAGITLGTPAADAGHEAGEAAPAPGGGAEQRAAGSKAAPASCSAGLGPADGPAPAAAPRASELRLPEGAAEAASAAPDQQQGREDREEQEEVQQQQQQASPEEAPAAAEATAPGAPAAGEPAGSSAASSAAQQGSGAGEAAQAPLALARAESAGTG